MHPSWPNPLIDTNSRQFRKIATASHIRLVFILWLLVKYSISTMNVVQTVRFLCKNVYDNKVLVYLDDWSYNS